MTSTFRLSLMTIALLATPMLAIAQGTIPRATWDPTVLTPPPGQMWTRRRNPAWGPPM